MTLIMIMILLRTATGHHIELEYKEILEKAGQQLL